MENLHELLNGRNAIHKNDRHAVMPEKERYTIVDTSENGYLISGYINDNVAAVNVGDILGISNKSDDQGPPGLELAIIRWMRREQDRKINFGVQIIKGQTVSVHYKSESDSAIASKDETYPGLYITLPESAGNTILIRRDQHKKDRPIQVIHRGKYTTINTIALLLGSPCYVTLETTQ